MAPGDMMTSTRGTATQTSASQLPFPPSVEMEPCIFPSFDAGDGDKGEFLSLPGRLSSAHALRTLAADRQHQHLSQACGILQSAWGVLLNCYTGLESVSFGFDDASHAHCSSTSCNATNTASTSGGHTEGSTTKVVTLDVLGTNRVDAVLEHTTRTNHTFLNDNGDAVPFNTLLYTHHTDSDGNSENESSPSSPSSPSPQVPAAWCKIRIAVDLGTFDTVFSWLDSFMTREQAMNVSSTYEKIVSEILTRQDATLADISCFSERNMQQVLQLNDNPLSNVDKCIHQAISEQGDLRPDAEAVCAWDGSLSYSELLSLADRLAVCLGESGVGPEIFVPLCFDKSRWTVVAMLAVLKAGGIFVPLDPTHPVSRLQALTRKVGARLLLCSRSHMAMLEPVAAELMPVDEHLFQQLPERADRVERGSPSNGAYMIFTSGTTGEPKGALIEHGSLLSSAHAHGPAMLMDSNTRSLQFAASTFDVSITEILTCLILGGCVCIPSEEARLNDIETAITELRANWALLTPTFVKFINPDNVPSLKTLVTGGEAMTQAIIRSWSHINLINCYGPAETSVVSHVHPFMREGKNPLNIGRQVGIHCWVVDPHNHNRLMPVGAVGELIIEGHTLAREYYKERDKTDAAFIYDPEWVKHQPAASAPRRMYKTGDLVKYNSDGSFHIAGRKDTQIKFHGQRIELGEIEHHLNVCPSIKHGMVILPKEGFCRGRLLTVIQLCDSLNRDLVPNGQPYKLLDGRLEETAKDKIEQVKQFLTARLPPYMIPSMWLAVEFIPRLQSGKLDRKQTAKWIDDMTEELYRRLNPVAATGSPEDLTFASQTELELHRVWSHVLNLKLEQLGLRQSFLSVGGDSISAMQVMSECRKRGLGLTVRHIIACKSIKELATHVKDIETPLFHKEILEHPFDLSPIQKLYFSRANHSLGHYNQSFLLRTSRRILASELRAAIETVIQRHSMLRARFSQDASGEWQQRVTNEVASSYRLRTVALGSSEEIDPCIADSQTCLSPTDGPLFAADLIDLNGEEELLFVVAHHLVIDLVSWRVILQDLEDLLLRPQEAANAESPLPFQTWCRMQLEHCQSLTPAQALPVEGIPDGNAEYWGMEATPNIYGQMVREGFEIGKAQTTSLLSNCHEALRTEIPDVLLAAMIYSFGQTFTDRPVPPVFAEGHGRESWDASIDLSNIVGWFTTIYPVFAGSTFQPSLTESVKLVKDARRLVPDKGRPYFASRWLTPEGREAFERHWPLEITFNYLGQYQQLEREGALFTPMRDIAGEVRGAVEGADVGPLTTCISFFEVSAVILGGALRFSFVFNENMKHQPKIRQWIASCEQNLNSMIEQLCAKAPEPTLSDFPLLSLTYDRLETMMSEKLPAAGIMAVELVEDAYPCSPMQSGLLVSTTKNSAFYAAYTLHEVKLRSTGVVDPLRLADAWRRMIEYHPVLRTIFIESVSKQDSLYDQVVLKHADSSILSLQSDNDDEAITALSAPPMHAQDNAQLLHRFTICTSKTGKVFCRLDISHVIMDGTSLSIVFRDLALAYDGSLRPGPGPLYRNYIKHLQEQPVSEGIDFWKSYLTGVEPCHFPVLDDANVVESKELRYVRVTFDELTELQKLCDDRGVTIVNAIYTAWALTLRLYTASEEVCFGYLTSARDAPIDDIRDVVGPVINMIVCRVNVSNSTSLGEIMASVQKDYLDSLAYRHISLAEVQHALQLSSTALFNTALSYRKLPPPSENPPNVLFEECRPTYDPDEYNVSINIEAGETDMAIDLMYWTDTLSDGQASNVASTFTQALRNILHSCDSPVAGLDHVGDLHRQQLSRWNSEMPAPLEGCIHDFISRNTTLRPDAPAIASWDMNFTYSELDVASTKLAYHLQSLGVGPEVYVLVCFEKSAFTIVSMIAILKAGGVCVPLDPAHPDAALQLRAEDTGAPIALVSPTVAHRFTSLVQEIVRVDADLLQGISLPQEGSLPELTPRNACFVIYTSGSTGRPKGVILEHRGIATNAEYSGPLLGYHEDSRVLQFASYTFDNSLAEIFTTLIRGGCVCVPSDHERLNDLAGVIDRHQVTLADITPTVATFLQPSDVPSLQTLALGGEAVTTKCVDIWQCSVNSTFSGDIAQPGKATNIGRAIGCVAWVVDPNDHNCLLPIGCIGELLIDGPIVSRGYLNLPEKTSQSFIAPPAWTEDKIKGAEEGRRLYKTGDLVRYDSDGTLMYLGRKDTQVKLNGQRIELGEIEHHIEQNLPEGSQTAVELVVKGGKRSLACFICLESDGSVPASHDESSILPIYESFRTKAKELEVVLSTKIPAYMVPTMWLPISTMPLTSSGKLNRRELRLQAQAIPDNLFSSYKLAAKSGRAPESGIEKTLCRLWASVLNIESQAIGVEDNFFKLGGDSIGAMRLVTLARAEEINLTVASIFQRSSLLDMAQSATALAKPSLSSIQPFSILAGTRTPAQLRAQVAAVSSIQAESIIDVYPCTPIQEGLMALSNKEPGAYVAQLIYRLPEGVDLDKFKRAWELVVQAEPVLRTRIVHTEELGFLQVVTDDVIEWSSVSSISELQESERRLPSHNGGKLVNYAIAGQTCFVWTIHHAIYDGWCLPLFLNKVKDCYAMETSKLVSGPSYASFIQYLSATSLERADEFWRSRLSDMAVQHFPRLPSPEYQANASSMMIHKTSMSRQPGSTITSATRIRAAWALTMSAYSAARDVVYWETLTGRDVPVMGIEEMLGPAMTTVPSRILLSASQKVSDLLEAVQSGSAETMQYQHAGIQRIKSLSPDAAIACGAQTLIAINSGSRATADAFWQEDHNEMAGTNFYTYPLMLSCHIDESELETVVHFDERVISEKQIHRVMAHFAHMLDSMSQTNLHKQVGELTMLSPTDVETLKAWNGNMPPLVNEQIHSLVEEQARTQPSTKISVDGWDMKLTYAELVSLSRRLASALQRHGIGSQSIVPLCFDKSALVVVSMLAVLQAGAAFVPIDPAHPDARISGILADTESTVMLCSPSHAERCGRFGPAVIPVSQESLNAMASEDAQLTATSSPSSAAYVIFTSGTTGKPKGTIVEHAAFCTGALAHAAAMGIDESSRVLQFASYTFDASIMEILSTLLQGGTVCIPSDTERNDIAGTINRMQVNWTLLTPSVAQLIQPSLVPNLKTLVLGGEAMSSAHISTWSSSSVQLMNAYGPSESSVVAAVNPCVTIASGPANIGHATGGLCWVTDAVDHDKLVPVGVTGELVLEGPILARGYLKNEQKTAEAFIVNPAWTKFFPLPVNAERRMYKTGDLVKLADDGTIVFQGRKDSQVKLRGQRLELSEIEHHLAADDAVQYGLAAIPSSGPCKKHLVAVLSLKGMKNCQSASSIQLIEKSAASSFLTGIRERVTKHLPSYMVPSKWIVINRFPLLPSGKLDRREIVNWVESMTEETHRMISDATEEAVVLDRQASDVELKLRAAIAKSLNLKVEKVPFNQSFLHLGGDSISAMKLIAVCRSSNLAITVPQVMQSKSIVELATHTTMVQEVVYAPEEVDKAFPLSPIQKLFFQYMGAGSTHFNQSVLLGVRSPLNATQLAMALETIIQTHSMLRARFSIADGVWSQRITNDVSDSYRLRTSSGVARTELSDLIGESQRAIDIFNGPLFVADLFDMADDGSQVVVFAAHHLVIDVVSWQIILQDLELLLTSKSTSLQKPLSFQTWNTLQHEQALNTSMEQVFHRIPMPSPDLGYWGMEDMPNVHGDAINEAFTIDPQTTSLLLGPCHASLQTDIVDVLIASMLCGFRQTFSDRLQTPPIFNEGHGREPWDNKTDLSRTVGWFTTLCPIYLPESIPMEADILDFVVWVKDFRRRIPGKGRPAFARSLLSEEETQKWPVEIAFNFLGQTQEIEDEESVFKTLGNDSMDSVNSLTDIGPSIPRLSLVEISASIVAGTLNFHYSINRHMKHQDAIGRWMATFRQYLHQAVEKLSHTQPEPTMADFSLLPMAFTGLSQLRSKLPQMGLSSLNDIEAVYPCSPVQQGIIFTQIKNPDCYAYSVKFEVKSTQPGTTVDEKRLAYAWQSVVQRHATLRTVFVASLTQEGAVDQVVLKKHAAKILQSSCGGEEVGLGVESALGMPEHEPPHRLTVCKTTSGRVFCLLEMSHAISDGTSMPILFRDLAMAYHGSLPPSNMSAYANYIAHLQAAPNTNSIGHWKEYLSGVEPCYFPTLNDGTTEPRALHAIDQNISNAAGLQQFCTDNGVTLSNVLQLAWALVLQAYTGLDDVCFGYLVSGRDVPVDGIDEAIGVFINMLVCRVILNPESPTGEVLSNLQAHLLKGMQHKHVSLADIQHETHTANAPLFNTAYSFQRRSVSKSMATGPLSFDISDAQDPSEYTITVNVEVWDSSAELQLCYWTDKISDSQAKNIASTFDQILTSILSSGPSTPVRDLDLLSQHCSHQLAYWNHAEPVSIERCVHHVIESNAQQKPATTPAVDAWDARMTYNELNAVAARIAQHLVSLGIQPGVYVPLCFEKSAWTVVAMLSVLKAGGAFVPLDPTHPPERISFLLQSINAKVVLCSPSLRNKFENSGIDIFAVGEESVALLDTTSEALVVQVSPHDPAYIIFTSGTTGLPKGTIIEHGAFTTAATAHAKAIKMTSTSRVLQFASHTFDASIMEILSTLLVGGCVCIPSDQDRLNDLAAVIDKFQINWTLLTPSVANVLKPGSVPSLKVLVTGGEAMSKDHITKWSKEASLVNAYGPSETSVIAATSTKVDEDGRVLNNEPACIGHAVGSRSWVVDPRNHNRLMPIGSIGELVVEGPIVARGYLDNEIKTREAFIQHPPWRAALKLAGDRTDRMYKTGDLVVYNSDGSLNYKARKDTQIKLNGQRIELGEIEHHVKVNLPTDVQSAVDLVIPQSKTSAKALAVFFTVAENVLGTGGNAVSELDNLLLHMSISIMTLADSLRSALKDALPSYMIPTIYIPVVKMPWTLAGKLDRSRLKAIVQSIPQQSLGAYKLALAGQKRRPATIMQKRLQKLWQKILGIDADSINIDDSFFRLGGDSVGAMKLVALARSDNIALTVINVFRYPKLSEMAKFCGELNDGGVAVVSPLSLLGDVASPTSLLDEVAALCGISQAQIQDQPGAYVAENIFKLPEDIDIARFKLAWQMTVDRVEILRARIINAKSSRFYQVVFQPRSLSWESAESLETATGNTTSIPGRNGGPLSRYTLVNEQGTGPKYFVWAVHHALYDAWSMPSMIKLVEDHYHQAAPMTSIVPFVSFARYLTDLNTQASNEFWKARLDGAAPTRFPSVSATDKPSGITLKRAVECGAGGLDMDITLPTIVRAAWALVVGSQTSSDDVVFGETLSGRDIALPGVSDVLGPTLTTVPTRIEIKREMSVRQFLKSIHDKAIEVIPYQHTGLQAIKRLGKHIAQACDFNNLLVIQSSEGAAEDNTLMQQVDDHTEENFFTYPLVVECSIEVQGLALTIHYHDTVITEWQMKSMIDQFGFVVQQLNTASRDPTIKVGELSLCGPKDVQVIREWNNFKFVHVEDAIPSLFSQVVSRLPDATAISAWDGELSYKALSGHATRMSKFLISKGLRHGSLVLCCMDKSLWTSISMLSVILSGGTIVPLDPSHPPARHTEIARDCQATIALCSPQHQERFSGWVNTIVPVNSSLFSDLISLETEYRHHVLPTVTSRDAAFVIYTSGSTGKPKGVVIEQYSFCTSSRAFMKTMNFEQSSRVFHFSSYAFDIGMGETFAAFTAGACLCVPSEEMRTGDLAGAMNDLGVTWAFLTPSVANILDPSSFQTLKTLVCGGEALTPETIKRWADRVELMNGYGPAECTIFSVSNTNVSQQKNHTIIGRGMEGGRTWIVDPRDHNYLTPLGCVGELLMEGPIVARGYLNDQKKTAESFIENPGWAHYFKDTGSQAPTRLYKTGDLVKYNPDGTLTFMGRKDFQVKLNGQRMELGEIEANLEGDQRIRHALVSLPKTGICKGRLVAVVSLRELIDTDASVVASNASTDCVPVSASQILAARQHISAIQDRLSEHLPPYMVPSTWLVVEAVPLMVSGKLDRTKVRSWIASMDMITYKEAACADESEVIEEPESPTGQLLRQIWASILRMPEEAMPINQSFISMGGDSIGAMQMMTRCRDHSIRLSMQEIIKSKSITDLAKLIDTEDRRSQPDSTEYEEQVNRPFSLSPIQQLFFNNSLDKEHGDRFNQSQLLEVRDPIQPQSFRQAIHALVERHSMLRSRFAKSQDGTWSQTISADINSSYSFRFHENVDECAMTSLISRSQNSISIQTGPLFAADAFQLSDGPLVLSLVAHHLVIDVVSWFSIIRDLEAYLKTASLDARKPFSFQSWCHAQAQHAKLSESTAGKLPFQPSNADLGFWGMLDKDNTYGDVARRSFVVSDPALTSLALGDGHAPLRTEPLDLFISAVLQSFGVTFAERDIPTLFNEGHGREVWDSSIDISQTVGWFTSLCPVRIAPDNLDDGIESIRRVKDVRRSIPDNGRPYFAHRYLTNSGQAEIGDDNAMEILFNYLGRTQQSSQEESLLSPFNFEPTEEQQQELSDVGSKTARLALFEISVSVTNEGIQFVFMYNKSMLHQDRISKWVSICKAVLEETISKLSQTTPAPTLSDIPLMPVNYAELQRLITKVLPASNIFSFEEVEDIYPCSPMQTGMLLSQLQDPARYLFHTVLEVQAAAGSPVNADKLAQACAQVVNHHAALRTIFINSVYRGGSFDQVVLKPRATNITILKCKEIQVMAKLNGRSLQKTNEGPGPALPYQITICQTPQGKVFMKLEMNHAVTDGASTALVMRDITRAYNNSLPDGDAPTYREYVKYTSSRPTDLSQAFWTTYLRGAQPTEFPRLTQESDTERSLESIALTFDRFSELHALCSATGVTFSSLMLVAWALTLRVYTRSEDICFGYLASGRDAPVENIEEIVGPFINMLVFRFHVSSGMPLKGLFHKAQEDYLASLPHQHYSLARVNHALGMAKKSFFNTAVSIQNSGSVDASSQETITFEPVEAHDPSEYAVTLNVNTARYDEGVVFRYWSDILSANQAEQLARTFSDLLDNFINNSEQDVSQLRLIDSPQPVSSRPLSPQAVALDTIMLQKMITETSKEAKRQLSHKPFRPRLSGGGRRRKGSSAVTSFVNSPVSEVGSSTRFSSSSKRPSIQIRRRESMSERLNSLWRRTLGLGDLMVTDHDSFFELGGDSIIAMSMVGSAREEDMPLNVADIFKNPTFGELLQCLLSRSGEDSETTSSDDETLLESLYSTKKDMMGVEEETYEPFSLIDRKDVDQFIREHVCPVVRVSRASIADVLPTTDFQALAIAGGMLESRWMLNHFYLDGSGPLDVSLLHESIINVVASYDILRTVFISYEERYLQVVLRHLQPDVRVYEDVEDIEDFTIDLERQHREEEPRLGESNVRFIIAKQSMSDRHRIFLRISHAQYDGVCFPAILNALKACYEGEPITPAPSYAKFVRAALGKINSDHYNYWRRLLKGASMTDIVSRGRQYMSMSPVQTLRQVVAVQSLASSNITSATIIKAAWSMVLAQVTGKSDVVFGHLISGRNVAGVSGIENIIGPCLNTVPVRVRFQPSWNVLQLLRHIQDQQVENMPYESLGFREIISKCTDWDADMTFSTVLQHQSMPQTGSLSIGSNSYRVGALAVEEDGADFSVITTPLDAASIEVCVTYAHDHMISQEFAEGLFDSLCRTITAFSTDLNASVTLN
ncbi:hypothetical protein B0I35DRAFT_507853 [Stachybotrys elegans]|uniref:Carrier domain-containing protein n=1 Tax=Stachybotrys elegans TaxID=80388 RepID=A0A8K0T3L2_9HYPO|nr:hypothetical protein B0I35DRAFT_507853 [Stachybotrys elegans]